MRRRIVAVLGMFFVLAIAPAISNAQSVRTITIPGGGGGGGSGGSSMGGGGGVSLSSTQSVTAGSQTVRTQSTSSGTGSATGVPSTSNIIVQWYGDPFSMGLPTKYATGNPGKPTATFGKGNYSATTATSAAGGGAATTTQANGFNTYGTIRNPQYVTSLPEDFPTVVHQDKTVCGRVKDLLDRTSRITRANGVRIEVFCVGGVIELRGTVASEKERLVAEGMARMTPGVREVRNDLALLPK